MRGGWAGRAVPPVVRQDGGALWVGYDLLDEPDAVDVDWAAVGEAYAAFAVHLAPADAAPPREAAAAVEDGVLRAEWPGEPALALRVSTRVADDPEAVATLDGAPAPVGRLADERLA